MLTNGAIDTAPCGCTRSTFSGPTGDAWGWPGPLTPPGLSGPGKAMSTVLPALGTGVVWVGQRKG